MYIGESLEVAHAKWLVDVRVRMPGEHTAMTLYDDFSRFVRVEKLMKRGPGPTPFGYLMRAAGTPRRIWRGLTHYTIAPTGSGDVVKGSEDIEEL
jgi:hypothetical protein